MATPKPRVYLFHGSDTQASLQATRSWVMLFQRKFSDATLYSLEADEMTADALIQQFITAFETVPLFPTPKLIVVKRLSSLDRNQSTRVAQNIVDILDKYQWVLDETITIVIWEDKRLLDTHPLVKTMCGWQTTGIAQLREFKLPQGDIRKLVQAYLSDRGYSIEATALQYIQNQYREIEQESRSLQRIKSSEVLKTDLRGWWLYGVLDGAMLRSITTIVTLNEVKSGVEESSSPLNAYLFSQAILRGDWSVARFMVTQVEIEDPDEGMYFSLYAAVRWACLRSNVGLAKFALQLLAEIELLIKNIPISHVWLLDLFITRLEQYQVSGKTAPIIAPRLLWLSQLPRS